MTQETSVLIVICHDNKGKVSNVMSAVSTIFS